MALGQAALDGRTFPRMIFTEVRNCLIKGPALARWFGKVRPGSR